MCMSDHRIASYDPPQRLHLRNISSICPSCVCLAPGWQTILEIGMVTEDGALVTVLAGNGSATSALGGEDASGSACTFAYAINASGEDATRCFRHVLCTNFVLKQNVCVCACVCARVMTTMTTTGWVLASSDHCTCAAGFTCFQSPMFFYVKSASHHTALIAFQKAFH